jgi:hypothetical protein
VIARAKLRLSAAVATMGTLRHGCSGELCLHNATAPPMRAPPQLLPSTARSATGHQPPGRAQSPPSAAQASSVLQLRHRPVRLRRARHARWRPRERERERRERKRKWGREGRYDMWLLPSIYLSIY